MAWLFIKEKPTSLNKLWAEIHIKSLCRPVFSQKYDTSFLVFRAWPGFLVALLQMTVFRCTYVPQSRGELLHHQLVTRETMQASGLGGDVGGTVTPLSPLEQPQLAFWGGAWTLEAARRRRGPPLLDTPPRQHSDTNIFNGNALHSA